MRSSQTIAALLRSTRDRTLELYEPLADADIVRTPDPIMSPPVWDLGHIAAYEELWVPCTLGGRPSLHPDLQRAYDAFETPRPTRTSVRLLDRAGCERYLAQVREDVLEVLDRTDLSDDRPLATNGFVFDLVAQHEAQHTETVLQTLQMFEGGEYAPVRSSTARKPEVSGSARVAFSGGATSVGSDERVFTYDCERPRHDVHLAPFSLARSPVTNGEFIEFIADGGYLAKDMWSTEGWAWRVACDVRAPLYWRSDGGTGWVSRSFDLDRQVEVDHPVCHVSYFEAQAYATWTGARLPTEAEWEHASLGARVEGAHLDQLAYGTAPVGARSGGRSAAGCEDMFGNVWEWTSSRFTPYDGFCVDPYPQYSQVFFGGDYQVLRGGSWATQPMVMRSTFRNWDHPYRRQIFAGLRLAWDGE